MVLLLARGLAVWIGVSVPTAFVVGLLLRTHVVARLFDPLPTTEAPQALTSS